MADPQTALTTRENHITMQAPVGLAVFEEIRQQAVALIRTGFLPKAIQTPEQAVAIVLMGREIGVPMMQALRKIHVINGTPGVAPELLLALANRTGELENLKITDDGVKATCSVKRKGRETHTTTFSMDDAKAMGLATKDNWTKQPKVMRQWRALSANLRVTFPDAGSGLYPIEELAPDVQVDEHGEPIATLLPTPIPPSATEPPRKAKPAVKFSDPPIKAAPPAVAPPPAAPTPNGSGGAASPPNTTARPQPPAKPSSEPAKVERIFETKFGKILAIQGPLTTRAGREYVQIKIADEDGREEGGLVSFHHHIITGSVAWRDARSLLKIVIERKGNFSYIERADLVEEADAAPPPAMPAGEAARAEPEEPEGPDAR